EAKGHAKPDAAVAAGDERGPARKIEGFHSGIMQYLTKASIWREAAMASIEHAEALRRFNRFYTRRIDVLRRDYLGSPFGLTEARVVYEVGAAEGTTATALGKALGIDLGYLSRLLQGLKRRGLLHTKRASHDARHAQL